MSEMKNGRKLKNIGFIGLGVMGSGMAANLMKNGYTVHGWARHPHKPGIQELKEQGLILHETMPEAVKASDAVITMVGFPDDVRSLYLTEGGILDLLGEGGVAVDMTTSDPELAAEIYEKGREKGAAVLDAPVTGGDLGAKNGTLTILAGGDEETFEQMRPVFEAMGQNIRYFGKAGSGQKAKLVNQILIAGTMAGLAEAWTYAEKSGLDLSLLFDALKTGAAGSRSMDLYWPRLLKGDMEPGFFIKHFIKDMNLALNEAEKMNLDLPVLQQTRDEYADLKEDNLGTQALVDYYRNEK